MGSVTQGAFGELRRDKRSKHRGESMLKKFRNCTFTQLQLKLNGGVGVCIGLLLGQWWPEILTLSPVGLIVSALVLLVPTIITVQDQFESGLSLERKPLDNPGMRLWS